MTTATQLKIEDAADLVLRVVFYFGAIGFIGLGLYVLAVNV